MKSEDRGGRINFYLRFSCHLKFLVHLKVLDVNTLHCLVLCTPMHFSTFLEPSSQHVFGLTKSIKCYKEVRKNSKVLSEIFNESLHHLISTVEHLKSAKFERSSFSNS